MSLNSQAALRLDDISCSSFSSLIFCERRSGNLFASRTVRDAFSSLIFLLSPLFSRHAVFDCVPQLPDDRASALDGLLTAHLGKAVARAGSRGVSFRWQELARGPVSDSTITGSCRGGTSLGPTRRGSCLQRCLSAAGGSGVLRWARVVGSTGLLPPSAAIGRRLAQSSARWCSPEVAETAGGGGREGEGRKARTVVVAVALNRRGDVDVHLVASTVSGVEDSFSSSSDCSGAPGGGGEGGVGGGMAGAASPPPACGAASRTTPWRLMGTTPIGEVWPSCLAGQRWGVTRILRAEHGRGARLWRRFLAELVAGEMAGVIALPRRLFGRDAPTPPPDGDDDAREAAACPSDGLAVALVVPISGDCAVCFCAGGLAASRSGGREHGSEPRVAPQPVLMPHARASSSICEASCSSSERGESGVSSVGHASLGRSCGSGPIRAELELKVRAAEVGLAMQESALARKRRRQAKSVPGKGPRGVSNSGLSIAGAEGRGTGSGGGRSGSLSQRDSGSLCFTGEGASGDGGGGGYDARQWRLETASVTSHGSGCSPRGYRLFGSTPGGAAEDDDRLSSTTGSSSGPKRALYQALEDVSSRSSLLGPDAADSSSTPGSKEEGSGWGTGAAAAAAAARGPDGDSTVPRSRGQSECVFPAAAAADDAAAGLSKAGLSDAAIDAGGASELPLSLMSDPALACLPGPSLPVELVALGERCARSNRRTMAAAAAAASAATATVSEPEGSSSFRTDSDAPRLRAAGGSQQRVGARQRFVDAVRSLERRRMAAAAVATVPPAAAASAPAEGETVPAAGRVSETLASDAQPGAPVHIGGEDTLAEEAPQSCSGEHDSVDTPQGGACAFEDGLSRGVAGLQMQYREVVEGGQRSPVDFVVRAVPEVSCFSAT